jgi:hypothetical protein
MRFVDDQERVCLLEIGLAQSDELTSFGANHNGRGLVLNKLDDDPDNLLSCLAAASHLLSQASDTARNRKDLDPRIQNFLTMLGPGLQSFINCSSMRDGGKEFHSFDHEVSRKIPKL